MFLKYLPSAFLTLSEVADLCYGNLVKLLTSLKARYFLQWFSIIFLHMLARHRINCSQKDMLLDTFMELIMTFDAF